MDWLMKYGPRFFAMLTLIAAVWQTFAKPSTLQWITLVLAALTVLTLILPQPKLTIDTTTPPKSK